MDYKKYYELGQKHQNTKNFETEWVYGNLADMPSYDDLAFLKDYYIINLFLNAGRRGDKIPQLVKGYRYNKVNLYSRSRNHSSEEWEDGISMAKIENDEYDWDKTISGVLSRQSKKYTKKYYYLGYLCNSRGSDGEPLIIPIQEIDKCKI